ncbi:MAG TPA: YebC/PmpR family DNA-binding transcriptional regulator [Planctomycetaceae bacterium]|nr:YebC/PmpR family DNA-binding transcriptional regulator [Planctomycetaceae bacterium]
MAGHSHWAGIKHRKAAVDSKRSKLWSKLSKAIIVAAKMGGGDPDANIRLRTAIAEAKSLSLPKDNIERAIKKGTGELDGGNVEEILYEGYGPGGVAIMCDIMTDNRNRTAPELRKLFDTYGGNLGATGCVSYLFERRGLLAVATDKVDVEAVMEIAMEHDALDVVEESDRIEIITAPENFTSLAEAFEVSSVATLVSEVTRIPQTTVDVDQGIATKTLALLEQLEDHDDVQAVSTNLNFACPEVADALQK